MSKKNNKEINAIEKVSEQIEQAKEATQEIPQEEIELKEGEEIGVEINGVEEKIVLDAEQAHDLNKQLKEHPIKITSNEIQVISSEFHNFGNTNIIFEKNKPVFITEDALNTLMVMPNFKDLVDKGVIKIGL